MTTIVTGARIFDGAETHEGKVLVIEDGKIADLIASADAPAADKVVAADGQLIVPGFVDLQVNGGGGVLLNNDPSVKGLSTICAAHAQFGTTALLPTLITDGPDVVHAAVLAGADATAQGVPGFLGLHLEGPHLALSRKGTHDPALIRPMNDADLAFLVEHAGRFGAAMITIAPENVTREQVTALAEAGYTVSLGHTDTGCAEAKTYLDAGAKMATHLYNAMSPLKHREPGLVGAALSDGRISCGMIADGYHVDPVAMGIALRAKTGPGRIFLVTDAMSPTGTDEKTFELNGRTIYRRGGRLTLEDGTLAGADTDMLSCVKNVMSMLAVPQDEALRMASLYPAEAIGATAKGRLAKGFDADFVVLTPDLDLVSTHIGGSCVFSA
ncbi:N-acetylglucosamine-6-phosphate deacetylase [Martelella alba]|uniref:N-acetylglucosamine-6-phosphate deacetylase n=1 Tax=Martelella alba TaxID=2590451 RepID=A0A506UFC5_9HYPH|nr:N-acetylglucosamine-6-phosphate deacetylase [Martelella alba]TPW32468.1 N-acetylglucosamine-6-phosphate deacetylase [Martelella alba]